MSVKQNSYIASQGADFSAANIGFFPGTDYLSPYGIYFLGNLLGGVTSSPLTDYSGNARDLTALGTPVQGALTMLSGGVGNNYQLPFAETQLFSRTSTATMIAVARRLGSSGQVQLVGNIATTGNWLTILSQTTGYDASIATPQKNAARADDVGHAQDWSFVGGRYASNQCDILFRRTDMGASDLTSATAFTGEPLTDTSNLQICGAENNSSATAGFSEVAAVAVFDYILTQAQFDLMYLALLSNLRLSGLAI